MSISINGYTNKIAAYTQTQAAAAKAEQTTATAAGTAVRTQDEVVISAEARTAIARGVTGTGNEQSKVGNPDGETTFTSSAMEYSLIIKECAEIANAYYTEQMEENKRYGDPMQHIRDKYINEKSSHFRSYMTAEERKVAYDNEVQMLSMGRITSVSYNDYCLRSKRAEMSLSGSTVTSNQRARDQMEGEILKSLRQNNISEDTSFKLTVDPYDHYISISGIEDKTIASLIEQLLNQGDNGMNLYYHIKECNPAKFGYDTPEHYTKINEMKASLYQMVKDQTGLDIRTLKSDGTTIWTPDNRDLWEVLEQCASVLPDGNGGMGVDIGYYREMYDQIAKYGWQDDPGLSLEFRNGSLYDIGTEYGYGDGQNEWTQWVMDNYEAASQQMMPWVEKQAIELQVQREDDED